MDEVVNLRQARKARRRAEADATAAANRATHGRTKAEKLAAKIEKTRRDNLLDGARRED